MRALITSDWHFGYSHDTCDRIRTMLMDGMNKGFDIMIIAGDVASNDPRQLEKAFKHTREIVDKPILVVYGNHDYWSKYYYSIKTIEEKHEQSCKDYDIHYLACNPYYGDDFTIFGFDGWYGNPDPDTNDYNWMSKEFGSSANLHRHFFEKQNKQFGKCIMGEVSTTSVNVLVTHFNLFPGHFDIDYMGGYFPIGDIALERFSHIVYGHNHKFDYFPKKGVTVINPGSGYNVPGYVIIDLLDVTKEPILYPAHAKN